MKKKENVKSILAKKLINTLIPDDQMNVDHVFYELSKISPELGELPEDFIESYKEFYSHDELKEKMSEVYSNNFSEDEIIDIISFFNTETGQKWINKQSIIQQGIFTATEIFGKEIADKIISKMDKENK